MIPDSSRRHIQAVIAQAHLNDTEVRVLQVVELPSLLVASETVGYDPILEALWKEKRIAFVLIETDRRTPSY
jgi:hypothetical protein